MDGLRIALATDTYLPQVNGVSRTLAALGREIVRRGGEARVFTTTDPGAVTASDVVRYDSIAFWAYPQLRMAAPGARLARDLRAWQPTLVHAATPFGVGLAARAATATLGVPFLTSYHTSLSAYARFYQLGALARASWTFLRWFHNSGALTLVPSRPVADELAGHGFKALRLWERGVDCQQFNPRHRSLELRRALGFADDDTVAVYVGRIAREKGLVDLLAAARKSGSCARSRVKYLIVGDGPFEAEMRAGAPNEVVFTGRQEGDRLAALYASSDVFVFPSVTDTFGNVLLEAMASGLVIVAADAAATRSLVTRAEALFYPASDAAQFAYLLDYVATHVDERRKRAALGLIEAGNRSWNRVFDELFSAYNDVLRVKRERSEQRRQTPVTRLPVSGYASEL